MTIAQTRAARRRMKLRYHWGRKTISIAESIARERLRAERQMAVSRKKR